MTVRDNGAEAASVAEVASNHTYSVSLPAMIRLIDEEYLLQYCNSVAQPRTTSNLVYKHKHFFA
eukprot:scaffold276018_cov33-Prasinocladus_malaysianus.AAC.1